MTFGLLRAAQPRLRAALLAGAVVATAAPLVAQAMAPALTCGVQQTNRWERIPIQSFQPINEIAASQNDTVTAYTVDEYRPQDLAATNGSTILLTHSHGCAWSKAFDLSATPTPAQPFAGVTSSIVSVALLNGSVIAAAQEGSGAASRPHILVGRQGNWTASDNGLPAQGAPRLLRAASDGRTAYLTISPTASGGSDSGSTTGLLPGVPGSGTGTGTPTGFLYRTTDGGANWTLQTGATDLPSGGTGFSQLDLDPSNSDYLYGIVGGRLLSSRNGGASFTTAPGSGFTAVTAMGGGQVVAFTGSGQGFFSNSGGTSYVPFRGPSGVTSAAYRSGESSVVVESGGALTLVEPSNSTFTAIPAAVPARVGSLLGDRGAQSSIHALAGHALLRYVDPIPPGVTFPPIAVGDNTVPPPMPGTVTPAVRNVSLPIGSSSLESFTLNLPKNPTPLDLFFLVDVTTSMTDYIDSIKANIRKIVGSLTAAKVDLRVGVGILGSGPAKGEADFPPTYVYPPVVDSYNPPKSHPDPRRYVKPVLYKRIRAVGATDGTLTAAINQLTLETTPDYSDPTNQGRTAQTHEGQLIALKNLAEGKGTATEQEDAAHLPTRSAVPPGQEAGFRDVQGVRKIVILATNEFFDDPYGTDDYKDSVPTKNPHLRFEPTIDVLNRNHIQVIGMTAGVTEALPDLQKIARGTHTYAPPGGVDCGLTQEQVPQVLRAGDPLVCNSGDNFSNVIIRVLASLVDRQNVQVVPSNRTPVLGALDGSGLLGLDVKQPNRADFSVRVSCIEVKPGTYHQDVSAILRQTVVGRARLNVTCVKALALVRPKPVALGNPQPPAQPAVQPPAALPPPAPAAQPQVQPQTQLQTQVQVQPLTAGALQEQQELQLALAMNGTLKDDDPVFNAGQQMAMVDRRKREEVQALGVLALAMTACAGLGLARLRTKPEVRVRRAR